MCLIWEAGFCAPAGCGNAIRGAGGGAGPPTLLRRKWQLRTLPGRGTRPSKSTNCSPSVLNLQVVQADMEAALTEQVEACCRGVREAVAPLQAAAVREEETVARHQRECARLGERVEEVLAHVARLQVAVD